MVSPDDFDKYIWVPHRLLIKKDPVCTTKIRLVFNCSLRTGNRPSLNDCVYPGVNLFTEMWDLLLKFRYNRFVLLADIRNAFLMIGLNREQDKNCFCFSVKIKDELECFRNKTLFLGGVVTGPFILNFIIKHHVQKYCINPCTDMLINHFYVDNLDKMPNYADIMVSLYKEAVKIMLEGNFTLWSCNSNSGVVRTPMIEDSNYIEHSSTPEKVLGYLYEPQSDEIQLLGILSNVTATTKRSILSQNSSIFDPLCLCLPVTIKGRILLRGLWRIKLSWAHICVIWNFLDLCWMSPPLPN